MVKFNFIISNILVAGGGPHRVDNGTHQLSSKSSWLWGNVSPW